MRSASPWESPLLTGTAVRLRAYAGHGVSTIAVTRVTAFVTVAIVLGLLSLGSGALLFGPSQQNAARFTFHLDRWVSRWP